MSHATLEKSLTGPNLTDRDLDAARELARGGLPFDELVALRGMLAGGEKENEPAINVRDIGQLATDPSVDPNTAQAAYSASTRAK